MPLPAFRALALTEAATWLALIAASILKRTADMAEATQIVGPIHGVVFLVYAGAVLYVKEELRWSAGRTILALVAALLPLGTVFLVERKYLAEARAEQAGLALDR